MLFLQFFLKRRVKKALNVLHSRGMLRAVIYAPYICVALVCTDSVVWIRDLKIEIEPPSKGIKLDISVEELDALYYLFKARDPWRFMDAIREWDEENTLPPLLGK